MLKQIGRSVGVLFVSGSLLAACSSGDSQEECAAAPSISIPGIILEIYDAASKTPLAGATATLVSEGYEEASIPSYPGSNGVYYIEGARDRLGTYSATVKRSGYIEQTLSTLVVKQDGCRFIPAQASVWMVPAQ